MIDAKNDLVDEKNVLLNAWRFILFPVELEVSTAARFVMVVGLRLTSGAS